MRDNLSFIKTIKVVLLVAAVMAFGITCYQLSGSFMKGWKSSDDTLIVSNAYHLPIFENTIVPENDSLKLTGNNGFRYHLSAKYLVSGDVYNNTNPQKVLSFLNGFKMALAFAMLVFSILVLLKLYSFINDSSKGLIFTLENINRIKTIGSLCISLSLTSFIWDLCSYYISREVFSHTNFHTVYTFDFNYLLLVVGILTIVIMQVFKTGYELKQEQDLTV